MSERGNLSHEEESGSDTSGGETDTDHSYDYTGEDTDVEENDEGDEYSDEEEEKEEEGPLVRREQREDDWQYCEQGVVPRRLEPPQVYAPDRGPPLLDFLFVLSAFFAAVFAAYYTIFTETGVS